MKNRSSWVLTSILIIILLGVISFQKHQDVFYVKKAHKCFKNNNIYTIEYSVDKGWLIEEDLLDIKKQLQMCDYKPNEDIKSYKTVVRCDHSCIIDTIVASTCTTKGSKIIKCEKCDKKLKNIEFDYIAHNYVNSICSSCGEKEYTLIS